VDVAQAGDAVLAPPVGPQVRVVEGEVRPGVPVGGVVLPDRPPLPGGDVGTPPTPRGGGVVGLGQSAVLCGGHQPRVCACGGPAVPGCCAGDGCSARLCR